MIFIDCLTGVLVRPFANDMCLHNDTRTLTTPLPHYCSLRLSGEEHRLSIQGKNLSTRFVVCIHLHTFIDPFALLFSPRAGHI